MSSSVLSAGVIYGIFNKIVGLSNLEFLFHHTALIA